MTLHMNSRAMAIRILACISAYAFIGATIAFLAWAALWTAYLILA